MIQTSTFIKDIFIKANYTYILWYQHDIRRVATSQEIKNELSKLFKITSIIVKRNENSITFLNLDSGDRRKMLYGWCYTSLLVFIGQKKYKLIFTSEQKTSNDNE